MADRKTEMRRERERRRERRFRALIKFTFAKANELGAIPDHTLIAAAAALDSPRVIRGLMQQAGVHDGLFDWKEVSEIVDEDWPQLLQTTLAYSAAMTAEKNGHE